MSTLSFAPRVRDGVHDGVVGRFSAGGWGFYHRSDCAYAPVRGTAGVRDVVHGPWRYLAAHWEPCPHCRPPADARDAAREAA